MSVARDITERKRAEEAVQASLGGTEILLVGQLKGTIELNRKIGTAFTIVFSEENARQTYEPGPRPSI